MRSCSLRVSSLSSKQGRGPSRSKVKWTTFRFESSNPIKLSRKWSSVAPASRFGWRQVNMSLSSKVIPRILWSKAETSHWSEAKPKHFRLCTRNRIAMKRGLAKSHRPEWYTKRRSRKANSALPAHQKTMNLPEIWPWPIAQWVTCSFRRATAPSLASITRRHLKCLSGL